MGRPRRNSNKSDSGSTAGNVYNASLAAAQHQKALDSTSSLASTSNTTSTASTGYASLTKISTLSPQSDSIFSVAASEIENEHKSTVSSQTTSPTTATPFPFLPVTSQSNPASGIHRRSLSIAELVSLVSARNPLGNGPQLSVASTNSTASSLSSAALNALNLPDALRKTLERADSPILNALLPLIRQKLAAKTALSRRNSAVDPGQSNESNSSLDTQISRRSSTSTRSEDHRLSHKLAERKRRKEMKDIFDNLKDVLAPGVPKSSKWEILNEASGTIDDLLAQEQALLARRNELLKRINDSSK